MKTLVSVILILSMNAKANYPDIDKYICEGSLSIDGVEISTLKDEEGAISQSFSIYSNGKFELKTTQLNSMKFYSEFNGSKLNLYLVEDSQKIVVVDYQDQKSICRAMN